MSWKLRFSIVVLSTIVFSISTQAGPYTLEKCIEIALKNNFGVISAKNSYDAARWDVYSSYGQLLPSISISTDRSESWSPYYRRIKGVYIPGAGTSVEYGGNLSFTQSFTGLGLATYANIRQKHAQKHSYFYNYINAQDEMIQTIKEAYFNLIKAKMLVDVYKDAVKRGVEQLKVAQSKYELGSVSLSDVLKAKVQRSNAQLDLITAENNYSISKANLNFNMGINVAEEIEVVEDLPMRSFDINYNQALNEALANNPSYRKATFDLEMARSELWMAKANFLPTLNLYLSHSTAVDETNQLLNFEKNDASYYFGITLSYNIFNNFNDLSYLMSRKKYAKTQEESLENSKNAVALEVKQAYLNVQQNLEKLKLNEESVAAAQEDLNIVKEKYKLGAATIIEVLDAEVSFKQAQTNQVQAMFDYNLAVSRLEKAMGR
jgi:outer membrane protein